MSFLAYSFCEWTTKNFSTWINHLRRVFRHLAHIDDILNCFLMRSFLILFFLILPCIHLNIIISTTFICASVIFYLANIFIHSLIIFKMKIQAQTRNLKLKWVEPNWLGGLGRYGFMSVLRWNSKSVWTQPESDSRINQIRRMKLTPKHRKDSTWIRVRYGWSQELIFH